MLKLGAQFIRYHAKLQRTVWNGIRGTTYLHVLEMTRTNIKQTKKLSECENPRFLPFEMTILTKSSSSSRQPAKPATSH
ncbi:hypothetical protein AKJ16_DCAP25561 [Drosera capensis]